MNDNLLNGFERRATNINECACLPATVVVVSGLVYLLASMCKENCFLIDEIDLTLWILYDKLR